MNDEYDHAARAVTDGNLNEDGASQGWPFAPTVPAGTVLDPFEVETVLMALEAMRTAGVEIAGNPREGARRIEALRRKLQG